MMKDALSGSQTRGYVRYQEYMGRPILSKVGLKEKFVLANGSEE